MFSSSDDESYIPNYSDEQDNSAYNKLLNLAERLDENLKCVLRRISRIEDEISLLTDQISNNRHAAAPTRGWAATEKIGYKI